jgi:hypothetical protein
MSELATAGDTTALARLGDRQCSGLRGEARQTCLEDYFLALSERAGVRVALGALASLASRDRQVEAAGHSFTHVIGIRAWTPDRDVGEVFASCTGLFQSGCYHGVIQAYLTSGTGLDSAKVASLCDQIGRRAEGWWLRFQCVHGLGHGLDMIYNWDLPKALAGCDWLAQSWDREACYGGAFMENAVASMPGGHHTSARALAGGAGSGDDHGHHQTPNPGRITYRMRDSTDLLYPCTAVGDHYQRACYMLQGGIILQALGFDFGRAARECDRVPTQFRQSCYVSLGTNASGYTVQNTPRAIQYCLQGDPAYQPWCFVGVVKNYIDLTARPSDGIAFCRAVPPGRNQLQCWVAVGEQVRVLYMTDIERAEQECAAAGPGREACRYGAGLLAEPPAGLPVRPDA